MQRGSENREPTLLNCSDPIRLQERAQNMNGFIDLSPFNQYNDDDDDGDNDEENHIGVADRGNKVNVLSPIFAIFKRFTGLATFTNSI